MTAAPAISDLKCSVSDSSGNERWSYKTTATDPDKWIESRTRKDIKDLLDGEDNQGGAEEWWVYWCREHSGKCAIGDGQLNSRSPTKVRKLNNTCGRFTKFEVWLCSAGATSADVAGSVMCEDDKNPDFVLCGDDDNSDPVEQLDNLFDLDDSFIDKINAADFNQLVHVPLGSACSGDATIEAKLHADAETHPNSANLEAFVHKNKNCGLGAVLATTQGSNVGVQSEMANMESEKIAAKFSAAYEQVK